MVSRMICSLLRYDTDVPILSLFKFLCLEVEDPGPARVYILCEELTAVCSVVALQLNQSRGRRHVLISPQLENSHCQQTLALTIASSSIDNVVINPLPARGNILYLSSLQFALST